MCVLRFLLSLFSAFVPTLVFAFDLPSPSLRSSPPTIHTQYPDVFAHDGVMDAGSLLNPYVLESPHGRFLIHSELFDVAPNDGILDMGTVTNPMVILPDE